MAENPFDAFDDSARPSAPGNPFDVLDDDAVVQKRVAENPDLQTVMSRFARSRVDGISATARMVPDPEAFTSLDERTRGKAVQGELQAAEDVDQRAQAAVRDAQARGDSATYGAAVEAASEAGRRLAQARKLDEDNRAGVVRQARPEQQLALGNAIAAQKKRVDYLNDQIEQADSNPAFLPEGRRVEDVRAELQTEMQSLYRLEAGAGYGDQRQAVADPSGLGEFVRGLTRGAFGTVPEMLGGAAKQVGVDGVADVLRAFGRGVRRDTAAEAAGEVLNLGEKGNFGKDLKNFVSAKFGEGLGTSLPIIAAYMAGGVVGGVGGSAALGIGQMRNSLEEAFAEQGVAFPEEHAARYVYLYGTAIGALESLTEVTGMRALTGDAKRQAVRSIGRALAAGAARGAAMEGVTEALQEAVELYGVADATGKPMDYAELRRRMTEGFAAGAVPGAAFGAFTGAASNKAAFDIALEKAKELGFGNAPQKPQGQQPAAAPAEPAPTDQPPAATPVPADAAPVAAVDPVAVEQTGTAALDVVDSLIPDGVETDREMVAEAAAVAGDALGLEMADPAEDIAAETAAAAVEAEEQADAITLDTYLADGGSLSRSAMPTLARRMGVTEADLPALLDKAVDAGTLRKTAGGMYRRSPRAEQQAAPSEFRQAELERRAFEAIDDALNFGRQILPKGVTVEVADRLNVGGYELDALSDTKTGHIALAIYANNPKARIGHEGLHTLVTRGHVSPEELAILAETARTSGVWTAKAEAQYRDAYAGRANLDGLIDEEAAAHLVEARIRGQDFGQQANAIIDKIKKVLERIRKALQGRGFKTADDVLDALVSGEMAKREARAEWMRDAQSLFAIRQDQDAMAIDAEARQMMQDRAQEGVELPGGVRVQGVPLFAIRAFHGSPHDFDRFSMDKIGTGEGAQAFGHGLYFAESEGVAREYRKKLSAKTSSEAAAQELAESNGSSWGDMGAYERQSYIDEAQRRGLQASRPVGGRMYEVRINADPEDFLDWDKPLSQQSEKVRGAVGRLGPAASADGRPELFNIVSADGQVIQTHQPAERARKYIEANPDFSISRMAGAGELSIEEIVKRGYGSRSVDPVLMQIKFREAGIPGIRYLDQGSRSAGEGSRNYVVFDDKLIEIVAKDGVPVQVSSDVMAALSGSDAATSKPLRTNADGLELKLPFADEWGDPRFNAADKARAIEALRRIRGIDVRTADAAVIGAARDDVSRIVAQLFYYDPTLSPDDFDFLSRGGGNEVARYAAALWMDKNGPKVETGADSAAKRRTMLDAKPEDVPAEIGDVVAEARQAVDHLLSAGRKGVLEMLAFGDDLPKPKAPRVRPDQVGATMPSGFYFLAGRKLADVPDRLFDQGGAAVINHLRQAGVKAAEIEHFQLFEKFGHVEKPTRADFMKAIAERSFDFKRKSMWWNPERPTGYYDFNGTRVADGPRIPGRGVYFERLSAFPKSLKDGSAFPPGFFLSPHWGNEMRNAWASWRGSLREVDGWGKVLIGEEGQTDYMQGALGRGDDWTGRRPRVKPQEFMAMKAERAKYENVKNEWRSLIDRAEDEIRKAPTDNWAIGYIDLRGQLSNWTAPLDATAFAQAAERMAQLGGQAPGVSAAVDAMRAFRERNARYFAPDAEKRFAKTEASFTPETPIDDSYVRTMVRDLLLTAVQKKADTIAISTSETTGRIQANTYTSAAHFYDGQLKPALEKELRRITGDGSIAMELVKLPKALGAPRNEKPFTVWAAKLSPDAATRIKSEGMPLFALSGSSSPDAATGRAMRQDLDALGYYSKALEAAKAWPQSKGTSEQALMWLKKSGVKDAEIEATGIAEFIKNKAAGPEPSGASTQGRSNGGDRIAEIANGNVAYQAKFFKEEYDNLGDVSNSITDEIEKVLRDNGVDAKFVGASGQSVSRYITVNDGDRYFKLRISDHVDRHGSDYTVRIEDNVREVYLDAFTGERIDGTEYRELDTADREVYDWVGHRIDRGYYDDVVRDGLDAVSKFLGEVPKKKPSTSITKDEIISYLEKNRVGLRESNYGSNPKRREIYDAEEALRNELAPIIKEYAKKTGVFGSPEERADPRVLEIERRFAELKAQREAIDPFAPAKWSDYSLDPSNPTYRETVLHLPSRYEVAKATFEAKATGKTYDDLSVVERSDFEKDLPEQFASGHFPEPNITGHMMTSMVRDAEGRPVYLIDQIQSDWGQKLRDGGVRDEAKIAELKRRAAEAEQGYIATPSGANWLARVQQISKAAGLAEPSTYKDAYANLTAILNRRDHMQDTARSIHRASADDPAAADFRRLYAEAATADAATPGHPLVNTTDQWVNTTLRRALMQAAEADADRIAIPSGRTVESYNPQGDSAGNAVFYDQIVPKNLRNLLRKLDKQSPDPVRVDQLETPTQGLKGEGFAVFEITPEVKRRVMEEGQALFGLSDVTRRFMPSRNESLAGINSIVRDLAHDLGITVRQGLTTPAAKTAKRQARKAGTDISSYYDPATGVLRVTSMSDLTAILTHAGEAIIRRYDAAKGRVDERGARDVMNPLERLIGRHAYGLLGTYRGKLFGRINPTFSGVHMAPVSREVLSQYLLAWHNERIATMNRGRDPSGYAKAQRDLLNARRNVARYLGKKIEHAIDLEQQTVSSVWGLVQGKVDIAEIRDYVDIRYNRHSKIKPPPPADPLDPETQRAAFGKWFTTYITDRPAAEAQDPVLFEAFEDLLDTTDPVLSAKLDDATDAILAYAKAEPVQIVTSMISSPKRFGNIATFFQAIDRDGLVPTLADGVRMLYRGGFDDLHPWYTAVHQLLETHRVNTGSKLDLEAAENAYKLLRIGRHSGAWAGRDLEDGIKARASNAPEGPSLVQALQMALGSDRATALDMSQGGRYAQFNAYLIARRAVRLWDRFYDGTLPNPPLNASRETAVATIQKLEGEFPSFVGAADLVYEFQTNLLKLQRDAGIITPETFDTLSKEPDYIPFIRDMTDKDQASSRVLRGAQSIIRKIKGSDRNIMDPIATIAQKVYETRQIIATNDAKLALLKLAEAAGPGGGAIAERLDPNTSKAMRVNLKDALRNAADEMGVSRADANALVGLAQELLGDQMTGTVFGKGQMNTAGQNITWVYENGIPVPIKLADGDLGNLMMQTLQTFGSETTNIIVEMMAVPAAITRATVTAHPSFILRNGFVDGLLAWMYDKQATPLVTQAKGFVAGLMETEKVSAYARSAGLMGGPSTSALDRLRFDRDVRDLVARGYQPKVWKSPGAFFKELARHPIRNIALMSEASETGTRARLYELAYDRAIKSGLNPREAAAEAAFYAHDYLDYSRHGSTVQKVGKLVPFMNAALQGMDRYARLLVAKGDYGSAWMPYLNYRLGRTETLELTEREKAELAQSVQAWMVSTLVMGGISMAVSLIWAMRGDDDLQDVPQEIRATHWVIPIDGVYHLVPKELPGIREALKDKLDGEALRLPKGFDNAWFANLIERLMVDARQSNPRWFENYVTDLSSILNPPMEPQALKLFYEMKTGKDFFGNRDIIPKWKQERFPEMMWDEYTSEFAKWAGKKTGTAPYYIDHAMKQIGTSWARDALSLNVPGLPWYDPTKPEKALDDYFIARRFLWKIGKGSEAAGKVREIMGPGDPMQGVTGRLFAPYSRLDAAAETYKEYLKHRDPASGSEFLDRLRPAERAYAILDANVEGDNAKMKMVHPIHRADKLLSEVAGVQKEILGNLFESRKRKKGTGELIPLNPSEKRAAIDILTQYKMMEAHNALVVAGETGYAQRALFDTKAVMEELRAAVPDVADEFEKRLKKAKVIPFQGVREQWPQLRQMLESAEVTALSKGGDKRGVAAKVREFYALAKTAE